MAGRQKFIKESHVTVFSFYCKVMCFDLGIILKLFFIIFYFCTINGSSPFVLITQHSAMKLVCLQHFTVRYQATNYYGEVLNSLGKITHSFNMKFYNYESGLTFITTVYSSVLVHSVKVLITFAPTQVTPMMAGMFVCLFLI